MARLTGAFVLHCWRGRPASRPLLEGQGPFQADDAWRIEIVRIHDGERTVFTTFDEAWAWLRTQLTRSELGRPGDRSAPKGGGAT